MNPVLVVLYAVCLVMGAAVASGLYLVVRDTRRGEGRWGINPHADQVTCPSCGAAGREWRMPASGQEALWGGQTCKRCGTTYDKWGKLVREGEA